MKAAAVTTRESSLASGGAPVLSAEDEALKRNTDCVYFLASPLTCKKGDDCEYRHSEEARMNPRDCYYWLNGNCLNPKCAFRHPPLDNLVGTPLAAAAKASLPPSLPATSAQYPASNPFAYNPAANASVYNTAANASAYNPVKQNTPCYYFQKGQCLKGDRCAFMHGSQTVNAAPQQPTAPKIATHIPETQTQMTFKKPFGGLEKCNQQKFFQQENVVKPVEFQQLPVKPPTKAVVAPRVNGVATEKHVQYTQHVEQPRYKPPNMPSMVSGSSVSRTQPLRQTQMLLDERNFRRESDEFLNESSPGFDVLVEDELLESRYYEKEDDFGRVAGPGGRHMNSVNDYSSLPKFDRETYSDSRGYDTYARGQDRYPREQRKGSSERISAPERRLPRVGSPEDIDGLDLRHRLSKQRRTNNGSRSTVSPDSRHRRDDRGREDQRYQSHSRRDSRYSSRESSISNRLQGRISLPTRSSPDRNRNDFNRLSPGRPPVLPYSGRPQDRLRRREDDEIRGSFGRRDETDNTLDFAAPKRLVELKKTGRSEEHQTGRGLRKYDGLQELEGGYGNTTSFEGPKPLKEILKRKRREEPSDSEKEAERSGMPSNANGRVEEEEEEEEEEGLIPEEVEGEALAQNGNELESEDLIMIGNVGEEEEEFETSDQREGESDYEQVDEEYPEQADQEYPEQADQEYPEQVDQEYTETREEHNADPEEEYIEEDEEDGDDFAKRMGVMFS
ncbi:hypothetical protein ACHQM5_005187 [Ranunculus cassubicifolius]